MKKIVVLFGGPSSEKEVSQWTAQNFIKTLKSLGYNPYPVDLSAKTWLKKLLAFSPDLVLLATHGKYGEDGQIQEILEKHHLPYTGSSKKAMILTWDKFKTQQLVEKLGIKTPKTFVVRKNHRLPHPTLKFPLLIKPNKEGSSFGIKIIKQEKELAPALKAAKKFDDEILIQEYIQGREVTCGVIDVFGKVESLPIVEIKSKREFFDFKAKYDPRFSEEIVPAQIDPKLSKKIQQLSQEIYQACLCRDYARADFIIRNSEIYFLEINTLPGFTNNSTLPKALRAKGIEVADFIDKLITKSR